MVAVEIGSQWLEICIHRDGRFHETAPRLFLCKITDSGETASQAIARIFKENKIGRCSIIAYLPRHVIAAVRILKLPSTNPAEIKDMIDLQIGKLTPFSREEIIVSYRVIDVLPDGYTQIMLIIARRDSIVNGIIAPLRSAGISVDRVVLSSECVYHWFQAIGGHLPDPVPDDAAIIDIDTDYSDFLVVHKGRWLFTKQISIGAKQLGENQSDWPVKFGDELAGALERFHVETGQNTVQRLYISGAHCLNESRQGVIQARLGIPLERIDSILATSDTLPPEAVQTTSFSPVVGAAMAGQELALDLTPDELKIVKIMEEKHRQFTVTGILIAAIIMTISLMVILSLHFKQDYLAQLRAETSSLHRETAKVEKMRHDINLIKARLNARHSLVTLICEIIKLTPLDIFYTDLQISEQGAISLKGRAPTMSAIFLFVKKLEDSPVFVNVQAARTTTKKDGNTESCEFEITCTRQ
ncbi:MAG: PilN domain-containing protein [Verrucomicrobiota bacterium]